MLGDDNKPVGPGEVGRLARGGHVPLGYYKDPEKTSATFLEVDGKRYSVPGDFARIEADGTVTLLGRGSTCVNTGGEKVFPEEVERALKSHPDVFDALVVGMPDERSASGWRRWCSPGPARNPTRPTLAGARPRSHRRLQGAPQHLAGRRDQAHGDRQGRLRLGPRVRRARQPALDTRR